MKYLIWSHRHNQWWGPDKSGYTNQLQRAGNYMREEASSIVFDGLPGANIPVPNDLVNLHMLYLDKSGIEGLLKTWASL